MVSSKKSKFENLDMDVVEDEGFFEGDINIGRGKTVATFNFGGQSKALEESKINSTSMPRINNSKLTFRVNPKGLTPAVDGELFTVKRCYQFRPSTIKKLNELKANHPDINAYLNTIIDEAILRYYDYVFGSNR